MVQSGNTDDNTVLPKKHHNLATTKGKIWKIALFTWELPIIGAGEK